MMLGLALVMQSRSRQCMTSAHPGNAELAFRLVRSPILIVAAVECRRAGVGAMAHSMWGWRLLVAVGRI